MTGMIYASQQPSFRGLGGGLTPYLRNGATRVRHSVVYITASSLMSETWHYADAEIVNPGVIFGDWVWGTAGTELTQTGTKTWRASVQVGSTDYQVLWSGSPTVAVTQGNDTGIGRATVTIPAGTWFRVRNHVSTTGTVLAVAQPGNLLSAKGEAATLNGADQTMSGGTVTNTAAGSIIFPLVIVGETLSSTPSIAIFGNSRQAYQNTGMDADGCQGSIEPSLGTAVAWGNYAVSSTRAYWNNRQAPRVTEIARTYFSHFIGYDMINDASVDSRTLAQMQDDVTIFGWRFANSKAIIFPTTYPRSTGTYTSDAGQTTHATDSVRESFNDWALTFPGRIDAAPDVNSAVESLTKQGVYRSDGGIARTTDGLHGNGQMSTDIKASGVLAPAIIKAVPVTTEFSPIMLGSAAIFGDAAMPGLTPTTSPGTNAVYAAIRGAQAYGALFGQVAGTAPGFSATAFNGARPGITFVNAGQIYTNASAYNTISNGADGMTLFLLAQISGGAASIKHLLYLSTASAGQPRVSIQMDANGKIGVGYRRLDGDSLVTSNYTAGADVRTNTPILVAASFDPVNNLVKLRINGTQVATYSGFASTGAFTAGSSATSGLGQFDGCATQWEVVRGALSDADMAKWEGFAAHRAGVSSLLPVDHTYKSAAPTS